MYPLKSLTVIAVLLWNANGSLAQTTLNASGGSKTISGNTYEYSIGEMTLVNTSIHPGLEVTQGLLQPLKADGTGIVNNSNSISPEALSVYPNPFEDILNLQAAMHHEGTLAATVFDITGRELATYEWHLTSGQEKNSISLQSLAAGSYMLLVRFSDGSSNAFRTFKIQKVQ